MSRSIDHDRKSEAGLPTHAEIAAMAHKLWLDEGKPAHSAERHWLEAERELKVGKLSRTMLEKVEERSGSVQS